MSSSVPTPLGLEVVLCPPPPPRFFQMMSCEAALEGGERPHRPQAHFLPREAIRKPHLSLLSLSAFHIQMFGRWGAIYFALP